MQLILWDLTDYQDRLQLNKSQESSDVRTAAANMVRGELIIKCCRHLVVLYSQLQSNLVSGALSFIEGVPPRYVTLRLLRKFVVA